MRLHHFYWRGKERTVSIEKRKDTVTLRFIDEEIIEAIGGHLLQLNRNQNDLKGEQPQIREIITVVREYSGSF